MNKNRSVTLRRPDGQAGSYSGWLQAEAARWMAASAEERAESQAAARKRHDDLNAERPKAQDGSGATVLLLYDEIGYWGISAADLVADLMGIPGDLELHLNTPGGDVFDGLAIGNALKQRAGQVRVVVDGLAASIGSVIAMAASPGQLVMSPNATMMIHEAWGFCIGPAADMAQTADLLNAQSDNIAAIYAARSGKPAADWRAIMRAESWMVGQEAVDAGLADAMSTAPAPDDAAAATAGPAAGLQVIILSSGPAPRPPVNADADTSAWDGAKAMANGAAADDPAAFYKGICAGRREGDADKQSSWALPYKYHPSDPPNADGTRNALARLPQTEGLTNEAEAKATLQKAMKQVDPDYEPPDDTAPDLPGSAWDPELLRAALKEAAG